MLRRRSRLSERRRRVLHRPEAVADLAPGRRRGREGPHRLEQAPDHPFLPRPVEHLDGPTSSGRRGPSREQRPRGRDENMAPIERHRPSRTTHHQEADFQHAASAQLQFDPLGLGPSPRPASKSSGFRSLAVTGPPSLHSRDRALQVPRLPRRGHASQGRCRSLDQPRTERRKERLDHRGMVTGGPHRPGDVP